VLPELATVITNEDVPGAVGVPEKLSDDPEIAIVIPDGNAPELTAAVYGAIPPAIATEAE
jgi:hypothetical protein